MRKPPAIAPGDTLAIVSPASACDESKLANGIKLLEDRGYKLVFGKACYDRCGFLAGADEARARDLHNAWFDQDIKGIICSRGGYGTARLMSLLDLDRMAAIPKLFAGFSDITTLHLALNRRGLATLHAPMVYSFVKERPAWVAEMWFDAFEGTAPIALPEGASRGKTLNEGSVESEVTGGCLCLLCDSLATPDQLDAEGKIVLIEDVDEPPHRVDAMLTHLLNAGVLQRAAGIVVGEMTATDAKTDEGIGGIPWREVVAERLSALDVPIVVDFPFGHQNEMSSLPLGIRARLDADTGELTYLELGVEK
ncbi:MAG: LD-carboxypeptidase [Armatimonadetes bacterium]|nr:LD-carboxypeptidase [Armatimonadota bacterium]